MKVYTLNKSQEISRDIADVFDFFSKPENLCDITPSRMNFNILTPSPIEMKEAAIIDYTIKILGLRIRWRTIITKYDPPNIFIDQQLKGPYSMWHHTHSFKSIAKNKTLIEDTVHYCVPFGVIGRILHRLYIKRDLKKIFLYREKKIKQIFQG